MPEEEEVRAMIVAMENDCIGGMQFIYGRALTDPEVETVLDVVHGVLDFLADQALRPATEGEGFTLDQIEEQVRERRPGAGVAYERAIVAVRMSMRTNPDGSIHDA